MGDCSRGRGRSTLAMLPNVSDSGEVDCDYSLEVCGDKLTAELTRCPSSCVIRMISMGGGAIYLGSSL